MTNNIYGSGKSAAERLAEVRYNLEKHKEVLADKLRASLTEDTYFPAFEISQRVNMIARIEGELQVAHLIAKAEENEWEHEDFLCRLLTEATRSPDDTWSGRSGDVRRSYNDGLREALQEANLNLAIFVPKGNLP